MWNGYKENGELVRVTLTSGMFLPLYVAALEHKSICMEKGSQMKTQLADANDAAMIRALAAEWGFVLET